MKFSNLKYAALPMMALASVGTAWGQANPKVSGTAVINDENGDPVSTVQGTILVVGNLRTSAGEIVEDIVDIPLQNGQRIENTIRSVPGLQQFRRSDARSANPTSQGVTLRGLGGNASSRALLFVDGVPQADPFGGWVSWPGYDALNLASIRVRRGAGQVVAGPGALSGIIELDSVQNRNVTDFQASYGSRNSLKGRASLGRATGPNVGDGYVSASASYERGDGFTPIVERQRGAVDRGAKYQQAGLSLRAVAPISDEIELQANLRGFIDERDRGFDFSDNENSGADASIRVVGRGDWQWSALGYLQIRDFRARFGSVAADRNSVRLVFEQFNVPSTGLGTRFELRPPVGDDAEVRVGGDWRRTVGETNENFFFIGPTPQRSRNAGGRTDTVGAFLEGIWKPNDKLTFTAGARADRWNISNGFRKEINLSDGSIRGDDIFARRSRWEGSGRVGFGWQPDENFEWTFRGSAYTSWRLPTLNELYRPFRVGADATAANEMLRPERLKGGEIGIGYDNGDDFQFSATVFWNQLDNAIANVTLASGPGLFPGVGFVSGAGVYRQRQNLDAIVSKGLEIDGKIDLTDRVGLNSGYDNLSVAFGYAVVDAEVVAAGTAAALDGLRPAQVPEHSANIAVEFGRRNDLAEYNMGINLRYIGRQFENDANSRSLRDALTLDAIIEVNLIDNLWLEAYGENLFNAEVQAGVSGSGIIERATPRTLWLGLRVKL